MKKVLGVVSISFTAFLFVSMYFLPIIYAQPVPVEPAQQPNANLNSCVVTVDAAAAPPPGGGGPRPNVNCSGPECAYKFITDYVRISSRFGPRKSPGGVGSTNHKGIDLAGPNGTPLRALEPGVVLRVGVFTNTGNAIYIRDDNGREHSYFHMLTPSPLTAGQRVNAGDEVGKMDSTGQVTGPHLHYQIKQPTGDWANPDQVLAKWPNY